MTASGEAVTSVTSAIGLGATPKSAGRGAQRTSEYAELKRIVESHGLLASRTGYFVSKLAINGVLLVLGILALRLAATNPWWWWIDVVFLSYVFVQIALLGHDLSHLQFARGHRSNMLLGLLLGNLVIGVSRAWWNDNHNAHHARPNDLALDPNVDILLLACTPEQALSRPRWVQWVIRHQVALMLPIFSLEFFSMRQQSIVYAAKGRSGCARGELWLLLLHLAVYGVVLVLTLGIGGAILFALVHHALTGLYMASIFAPNHKGMPLASDREPLGFLRAQVLTARNVRGNWLIDLVYGGLNYQIEHHLFPTCPRTNLSRVSPHVRAYCQARGIAYCESGFAESWQAIVDHFGGVSRALEAGA
jgi:fatty acid desaturase